MSFKVFFKGSFSLLCTPHRHNTIFNHDVANSVLNDCVLDAICVFVGFLTLFLFERACTRNKGSFLSGQNLVMSVLGSQSWLPVLSAGPTHMN